MNDKITTVSISDTPRKKNLHLMLSIALILTIVIASFCLTFNGWSLLNLLFSLLETISIALGFCILLQRSLLLPYTFIISADRIIIHYYFFFFRKKYEVDINKATAVCYRYGDKRQNISISRGNNLFIIFFYVSAGWSLEKQRIILDALRENRVRTHYKDRYPETDF